jgi:hypothetical protein
VLLSGKFIIHPFDFYIKIEIPFKTGVLYVEMNGSEAEVRGHTVL